MKLSRHRWLALLLVAGMLGAAAATSSCLEAPTCCQQAADPALVGFMSEAKAVHQAADLALARKARPEAIIVLEGFAHRAPPHVDSPQVREVLADTFGRIAELHSAEGAFDQADEAVERGLDIAIVEVSHYRGRLREVQGLIAERRATALGQQGDETSAALARAQAIRHYEDAVAIQDRVVRQALSQGCECGDAVDPALLAFLSKASSSHHLADLAEEARDPDRALAMLEQLVSGPVPGGAAPPPEAREVLADAFARLAELRSAGGDFAGADESLRRGLELAVETTLFRGRLMEVRGLTEERRSKALRQQGDAAGAKDASDRAIKALQDAIEIQDQVIKRVLGDSGL